MNSNASTEIRSDLICLFVLRLLRCVIPIVTLWLSMLLARADQFGDFGYTVRSGSAVIITNYTGVGGSVIIPNTINGMPVVEIGMIAFRSGRYSLTDVVIPQNVRNINVHAFQLCQNLTSVTMGNGVTNIATEAFIACSSLSDLSLSSGLVTIGMNAFLKCSSLSSLTLPDQVAVIGDGAFQACSALTDVTLPNCLTYIPSDAFYGCSSLVTVTIPNSVTNISDFAFQDCVSMVDVTFGSGLRWLGQDTFRGCSSLTKIVIPDSVGVILGGTFESCNALTNVIIGSSVYQIGNSAFYDDPNLTTVYFRGNAPFMQFPIFYFDRNVTVYYLPGTTGWRSTLDCDPVLWNPQLQAADRSFGTSSNGFGFNIVGTTNIPFVLEACADLKNPDWQTLLSGELADGAVYFSDPDWTNYPSRVYRIRSP